MESVVPMSVWICSEVASVRELGGKVGSNMLPGTLMGPVPPGLLMVRELALAWPIL